ncbi:hypothetical protein NIES4075_69360 [Tolypothrix sp. NIES-4075]|uniref:hypothetical protein n=1 Tax=Tolypothrix sp. NIES-4075 TaxID=2005459 RepID=UPI000B6F05BD|nr:hypothetical protein [Tolypothrix sp. NIES-4075]GAX45915.1 hypothetical protein NIES4075_69360 [Tolypothrix sp. NIES-4075]
MIINQAKWCASLLPALPAVRELSRLHRQGRTSEVLQGLDELILALDNSSGYSTYNATSQTLSAIYERLDNLESQLLGESNSNGTPETKRLASLEQKIEGMTSRMAQFALCYYPNTNRTQQPTEAE